MTDPSPAAPAWDGGDGIPVDPGDDPLPLEAEWAALRAAPHDFGTAVALATAADRLVRAGGRWRWDAHACRGGGRGQPAGGGGGARRSIWRAVAPARRRRRPPSTVLDAQHP